jgi:hypothetical protein
MVGVELLRNGTGFFEAGVAASPFGDNQLLKIMFNEAQR